MTALSQAYICGYLEIGFRHNWLCIYQLITSASQKGDLRCFANTPFNCRFPGYSIPC